jgi:hypothetical protein
VPGHKRNPDLIDDFLAFDVPHYGGVENRRASTKRLVAAERLAAGLWGADWCGFSVQGSSHGNEAICLTLGKPGDKVVVARTIHKSLFFGIVLAGLVPGSSAPIAPAAARLLLIAAGVQPETADQMVEAQMGMAAPVAVAAPMPVPETTRVSCVGCGKPKPDYNHPNWPSPITKRFAKHLAKHSGLRSPWVSQDPKTIRTHEDALEYIANRSNISVETLLQWTMKHYQSFSEPWTLVEGPSKFHMGTAPATWWC